MAALVGAVLLGYALMADVAPLRTVGGAAAAMAMAVAIRVRRRFPVISGVAIAALVAVFEMVGTDASTVLIAPYLVAFYSIGAYAPPPRSVVGFGATYALTVAALFADPAVRDVPENALFIALIASTVWGGGVLVRNGRTRSARLAELTAQLQVERDEKARLAVDAERGRIARELHDVVAHGISLIAVQAGAGRHALGDDPIRARAAFGAIEQTARQALEEMRRMLGLLRDPSEPVSASPLPGIDDLDNLVDQARATGLAVDFEVTGEPTSLPPGVGLTAFRVVQEGLTNVRKHAPGAAASVTVRYAPAALDVIVTDPGPVGQQEPGSAGDGGGQGLAGMRERVALYGGRLEAGPRAGGGFSVAASLPVRDEA